MTQQNLLETASHKLVSEGNVRVPAKTLKKSVSKKQVANKQAAKKQVARKPNLKKQALNTRVAKEAAGSSAGTRSPLYYRLNTLLHTLRVVAGYEDQLCTLLHALRGEVEPSAALRKELRAALDELPATDLKAELDAFRHAMAAPRAQKKRPTAR